MGVTDWGSQMRDYEASAPPWAGTAQKVQGAGMDNPARLGLDEKGRRGEGPFETQRLRLADGFGG